MEGFRNAVDFCGFTDLGFIGLPYTWDNRQEDDHNLKVRLDRGLASDSFLDLYREVKVWHVQNTLSDHCCLIAECMEHSASRRRRKNFRYENMWQRGPSYMALIRDAWDQNAGAGGLDEMQLSLRGVKSRLQTWERDVFGSVRKSLAALRHELEVEWGRLIGSGPSRKEKRLMARISELLSRDRGSDGETKGTDGLAERW